MTLWIDLSLRSLVELLVVASVKSFVLLAAATVPAFALRRSSAATRHVVWSFAFAGCLAIPALSLSLPQWRIALPEPASEPSVVVLLEPNASLPELTEQHLVVTRNTNPSAQVVLAPLSPTFNAALSEPSEPIRNETENSLDIQNLISAWAPTAIFGAWGLGLLVCVAPIVLASCSLRRLRAASEHVTDVETLEVIATIARQLGLNRRVELRRGSLRAIPMTWGFFRTVVLLPSDSVVWSRERFSVALAHELAHVKRRDCLTQLMARFVCALYWFNPLAWFALGRLRAEQEQACDDQVMLGEVSAPAYAAHLLAIVSGRVAGRREAVVARAMASMHKFERRIIAILDPKVDRRAVDRRRAGLFGVVAAGLVVVIGTVTVGAKVEARVPQQAPTAPAAKKDDRAAEVLDAVREVYIKPADESALKAGAIKGMIDALGDPYSNFIDATQLAEFEHQLEGKLTGIGASLEVKDGAVKVIMPLPGSPAFKAGIKPGDTILDVDGMTTMGVPLRDVVQRIVGPSGTVVKLSIRRTDGKTQTIAITRGMISLSALKAFRKTPEGEPIYSLDAEHGIAYARISQFGKGTSEVLKTALDGLERTGLKGLILDLRGCSGGLMSEALDTVKLFLSKGKIITLKKREKDELAYSAVSPAPFGNLPLVILVNDKTASAAEIVSGALKDNDRAKLVGSRTFGKGSVQTIVKLKDGSGALRLTTAFYELPSGRNIDKAIAKDHWGVEPSDGDAITLNPKQVEALEQKQDAREHPAAAPAGPVTPASIEQSESDPQLAAALRTLVAKITTGEFVKVGSATPAVDAQSKRLEDIRKRREALLKDLGEVDKELNDLSLQKPASQPKD